MLLRTYHTTTMPYGVLVSAYVHQLPTFRTCKRATLSKAIRGLNSQLHERFGALSF